MKRRHFLRTTALLPAAGAALLFKGSPAVAEQEVNPGSRRVSTLSVEPTENFVKIRDAIDPEAVYYVHRQYRHYGEFRCESHFAAVSPESHGGGLFLVTNGNQYCYFAPGYHVLAHTSGGITVTTHDCAGKWLSYVYMWPETYAETTKRLCVEHKAAYPEFIVDCLRQVGIKQRDLAAWFSGAKTKYPTCRKVKR